MVVVQSIQLVHRMAVAVARGQRKALWTLDCGSSVACVGKKTTCREA